MDLSQLINPDLLQASSQIQQSLVPQILHQLQPQSGSRRYLPTILGGLSELAASLHPSRGAELQQVAQRQNLLRQQMPAQRLNQNLGILGALKKLTEPSLMQLMMGMQGGGSVPSFDFSNMGKMQNTTTPDMTAVEDTQQATGSEPTTIIGPGGQKYTPPKFGMKHLIKTYGGQQTMQEPKKMMVRPVVDSKGNKFLQDQDGNFYDMTGAPIK